MGTTTVTRKIPIFLALVFCIALVGCGGGESGTPASAPTSATPQLTTGTAALSWLPPAQNTDGSTVTNLAGYRIYYGTDASALGTMIEVSSPGITSYVVTSLTSGTYYFAISAYSTSGVESARSGVSSKRI